MCSVKGYIPVTSLLLRGIITIYAAALRYSLSPGALKSRPVTPVPWSPDMIRSVWYMKVL